MEGAGKKQKKEREEEADPHVHVQDRRFWARDDKGEGDEGEEETRYPTYVEELQAKLTASEKRLDETLAAHRRTQSEFEEVRLRLQRDFESRVRDAKAGLFRGLLEIGDHMELALQAAETEGPLAEGLRLIHGKLMNTLRDEGVERLEVVGRPFDPEESEAVAVVPVDDPANNGTVVQELRAGYRLGSITLRAAQVQVGKCKA